MRYRVTVDGGGSDLRQSLEASLSLKFDLRKNGPWPEGDFVVANTEVTSAQLSSYIKTAMSQAAKDLGLPAAKAMPAYTIRELDG